MTLYTIETTIKEVIERGCATDENGEFYEFDDLRELQIKREDKINNTVYFIKNNEIMIKALKDEEKILADRRSVLEKKNDRVKDFLTRFLKIGEKIETARYVISWRKSTETKIYEPSFIPNEYAKRSFTIKPDKKAIKQALKNKIRIFGCELIEKQTLKIK